ncbi:class I SAM-dependent methyltransferase [Flagellimonas sp.]|uniref:class I SAM-dependent methyltransferase n=1 Tax=Flagellimonas sp. TaxID=2058762 RepID=UPI003B528FA3
MKEIYEPKFVENLFDKMSSSYARVNYITSFGFSERWRRQCVEEPKIQEGKYVVDLMTGMGECWKHILKPSDENSILIGLDFSSEMVKRAKKRRHRHKDSKIEVLMENVFDNSFESGVADYVISGFGLKTFNHGQLVKLADEISRILKPCGEFSLIDVSVPQNKVLRTFYMLYLKKIIPILGKLFLGNPETYKMLGIYTEKFGNARNTLQIFDRPDFEVEYVEYFNGCASGIKGRKIK